jgi:dipeptidyl-peptidase III
MPASDKHRAVEATHKLEIRTVFDSLAKVETRDGILYRAYAHHLARACWHGSRIMLRQTSPEAEGIFDFILELHRGCSGRWDNFRDRGITQDDLNAWLEFAGMFLSSLGNHFVRTQGSLPSTTLLPDFTDSALTG